MNVISLNTAPKTAANKSIEGGGPSSSENQENPPSFANALKGQETVLQEDAKGKIEQSASQSVIEKHPNTDDGTENKTEDHQALAALLEKYLPPLTDNRMEQSAPVDIEAALSALTSPSATAPTNTQPGDASIPQDITSILASTGLAHPKPAPVNVAPILPEETMPTTEVTPQRTAVFSQSMPSGQNLAIASTDSQGSFKQTLDAVQNGPEQKIPDLTPEIMPGQKPVDTRVENLTIPKPISHPGWGRDLGEHIIWMNNKEISAAEIKLNPVHLGPISVRIDVDQDNQTSILFTAQHAETKEALETSLPRLREMLQGQQLNLVNVNISQNSGSNQGHTPPRPFLGTPGGQHNNLSEAAPNALDINESEAIASKGLLSLYA
jgi:flagellar hook-length control protein FliK